MKLIVGLGNPGNRYSFTRHNIGYLILDYLAEYLNLEFKPAKDEWYGTESEYEGNKFYLMKPTTFMNNSGFAVLNYFAKNEIKLDDLLVVYDDLNLSIGTIRVRKQGTDGGHNGISSIIYQLNTLEFPRMRIGIRSGEAIPKEQYIDYVLSNFNEVEFEKIRNMMVNYKDCLLNFLKEDIKSTMNKFNKNFLDTEKDLLEDNLQN
jgi:PTH1 family peptidyl-tRNA hydrolase